MNFSDRLAALDHPIMVEVVYLCGRYLSHKLNRAGFERQLDADVKTRYKDQSAAIVLEIMAEIEAKESKPIADLPPETRSDYADQIGEALWADEEAEVDAADVQHALTSMSRA